NMLNRLFLCSFGLTSIVSLHITFEEQVHLDHTSFIDASIPSTRVLIEQKGLGKDLKKPIKQSDAVCYKRGFSNALYYSDGQLICGE
ncbi:MAG: hypothetical protein LUE98_19880, partial [Tannerellaceae bacterium]|nr:hypothetical protein [Tannerellaceae bacterium]